MNPSGGDDGVHLKHLHKKWVVAVLHSVQVVTRNIVIPRYTGGTAAGTEPGHEIIL